MFHPVTSFVSFVECVSANTCTFGSAARSQFCIEVSPTIGMYFFAICRVLLDRSVHFSTWWSAYPEWGKYTLISLMRWWFTTIVAVVARSLMYLLCSA